MPTLNKKILNRAGRHAARRGRQTAERRGHPRAPLVPSIGLRQGLLLLPGWRQPNGEVWRISLLLHFDKSGNLSETLDLPDLNPDHPKPAKSSV